MSAEEIRNLQVRSGSGWDSVLVDHLEAVYDHLADARNTDVNCLRVDIVLDNAGFELFTDLILAAFLIQAGLAKTVYFHPKAMPWFVSDVTERDFFDLITVIANPESFFPQDSNAAAIDVVKELGQELQRLLENRQIVLRSDPFWTRECSFWELKSAAPELYEELRSSQMVIFKGDLNYRKLTADARWDSTISFSEAIGCLGVNSGVQVLALRTCKSDAIVGLAEGKDQELRNKTQSGDDCEGRRWAWNGEWAVAQFSDGSIKA